MRYLKLGTNKFEIISEGKTDEGIDFYEVKNTERITFCPHCQSNSVYMYGNKIRQVDELLKIQKETLIERRIKVYIHGHKYKCNMCNKILSEKYSFIDESTNLTIAFKEHLKKKSLNKPFLKIAHEYKVGETTVKNLFQEAVKRKDEQREWKAPHILNLCQLPIKQENLSLASDVLQGELLEILTSNEVKDIFKFLKQMEDIKDIQVVITSMFYNQKEAIKKAIPQVPVVVNQYYATKYVEYIFRLFLQGLKERVHDFEWRKLKLACKLMLEDESTLSLHVLNSRRLIFEKYPELRIGYQIYQNFKELYNLDSYEDALKALHHWISKASSWKSDIKSWIKDEIFSEIKVYLENILQWEKEILAFWKFRKEILESEKHSKEINNLIQLLVHNGSNYSGKILRGKILYGSTASKTAKRESTRKELSGFGFITTSGEFGSKLTRGFGVNIKELISYIENNPDFLT